MSADTLFELINYYYDACYKSKYPITKRKQLSYEFVTKIIDLCDKYYGKDADDYYKRRIKFSKKLQYAQEQALRDAALLKKIGCKFIIPVSSFSANMHLISTSNIDIMIPVKDIDKTILVAYGAVLESVGYEFKKIEQSSMPWYYYVYSKIIDGITVDIKIRDLAQSRYALDAHRYIDNKISNKTKKLLTYAKYLTHSFPEYEKLKYLFFECGLYLSGSKELFGKNLLHT